MKTHLEKKGIQNFEKERKRATVQTHSQQFSLLMKQYGLSLNQKVEFD